MTECPDRGVRMKLVTLDEEGFLEALEKALPELHKLLGASARIDAHRLSEFVRDQGTKFRAVTALSRP